MDEDSVDAAQGRWRFSLIRAAGSPEWFPVTGSHYPLWSLSATPTTMYKHLPLPAYIDADKVLPCMITTYW